MDGKIQYLYCRYKYKDNTRKRAMLLYQAGTDVCEIFKTLPDTGADDDYKTAVNKLTEYFEPERNVIYQTYVFRQAKQGPKEPIEDSYTRLRGLAKYCEFQDTDFEIKMQIVLNGNYLY